MLHTSEDKNVHKMRELARAMLQLAETVEFFLAEAISSCLEKARSIYFITAFDALHGKLTDKFGSRLQLRNLDWWRHNRHMTIVGSDNLGTSGLYFARRLRNPFITPVVVNGPDVPPTGEKGRHFSWKLQRGSA